VLAIQGLGIGSNHASDRRVFRDEHGPQEVHVAVTTGRGFAVLPKPPGVCTRLPSPAGPSSSLGPLLRVYSSETNF